MDPQFLFGHEQHVHTTPGRPPLHLVHARAEDGHGLSEMGEPGATADQALGRASLYALFPT